MTVRTTAAALAALPAVWLVGFVCLPAAAADDASTPPSLPKHEMGGNDSKPGFVDVDNGAGNAPRGQEGQKVPGPGKAAGASAPATPPVPMAK